MKLLEEKTTDKPTITMIRYFTKFNKFDPIVRPDHQLADHNNNNNNNKN